MQVILVLDEVWLIIILYIIIFVHIIIIINVATLNNRDIIFLKDL